MDLSAAKATELDSYFPTTDDGCDYDTIPDDYELYKEYLSHQSTAAPPPSYSTVVDQQRTDNPSYAMANQAYNPTSVCPTVASHYDEVISTPVTLSPYQNVQHNPPMAFIPSAHNPLAVQASDLAAPKPVDTLPRPMEATSMQKGDVPDRQTGVEMDADAGGVAAAAAQQGPEEQAAEEDDYIAMRSPLS